MELMFVLTSVLQSVAISLGVGCSTLAILNFFNAIADGTIDETERRMMGVVYVVLRVAMVLILLTTALIANLTYVSTGAFSFSPYMGAIWTLIAILYTNAILMTLHVVPSTIGPALQASAWYSLGIATSLAALGLSGFSYGQFVVTYICVFFLAVGLVNGTMALLKSRRATS